MKRIRISKNRADIAAALREAVIGTGAAVSGIIRDTDDTPSHFTDAFVFITDADNVEIPANCVGIVTIREARESDPAPEAPAKATGKRAREEDGEFKADDPATAETNEAWKDGKAPKAKKTK